jgi:imidazolonepropionase-like amidohydrolase
MNALLLGALAMLQASAPEALVVEGGTLFDGTGAVRRDAAIVIRGTRIEEVGTAAA